jgi:hypothetical protein
MTPGDEAWMSPLLRKEVYVSFGGVDWIRRPTRSSWDGTRGRVIACVMAALAASALVVTGSMTHVQTILLQGHVKELSSGCRDGAGPCRVRIMLLRSMVQNHLVVGSRVQVSGFGAPGVRSAAVVDSVPCHDQCWLKLGAGPIPGDTRQVSVEMAIREPIAWWITSGAHRR